jgi:ABC-type molybdate transport system substrate-binding protein
MIAGAKYAALAVLALAPAGERAGARRPELTVWSARALATVLAEAGPEFTRETGQALVVRSGLPGDFLDRVRAGERFDVLVTAAAPMDEWIRDGRVVAASRTGIARSGIGVAVKAGRPPPGNQPGSPWDIRYGSTASGSTRRRGAPWRGTASSPTGAGPPCARIRVSPT